MKQFAIKSQLGISLIILAIHVLTAICPPPSFSEEMPTIEIKILNQTNDYIFIDIGLGVPIRIARKDIKFIAEKLPTDIGRKFQVKSGSGEPAELIINQEDIDKLDKTKINSSDQGFIIDSLISGKIVFKDLTPPPENIYQLSPEQIELNQQLIKAAKAGNTFEAASLLQQGANPNARRGQTYNQTPSQRTVLDMINSADPNRMEKAVNLSVNEYAAGSNETPLLYAVIEGYFDIADLLLKSGADPLIYPYVVSPLSEAVRYRNADMIKLIQSYLHLPLSNNKPLSIALHSLRFNVLGNDPQVIQKTLAVAKILIDMGANVNEKDNYGRSILHYLCANPSSVTSPELISLLINSGADVDLLDNEAGQPQSKGETALALAMSPWGNRQCIQPLIAGGANMNVTDREGKRLTPGVLNYYVQILQDGDLKEQKDSYQAIKFLLDAGADLTQEEREQLSQVVPALFGKKPPSPDKQLSLSLKLASENIHPFEPLKLQLNLTNSGMTKLELNGWDGNDQIALEYRPTGSAQWKKIKLPAQRFFQRTIEGYSSSAHPHPLRPRETLTKEFNIPHDGENDTFQFQYYFQKPGEYEIRSTYNIGMEKIIESNVEVLRVEAYRGADEQAYQWLLKREIPYFIYDHRVYHTFEGSKTIEDAQELIHLFPQSTLAQWAKLYLARTHQSGLWIALDNRAPPDMDTAEQLAKELLSSSDPKILTQTQNLIKEIQDHKNYLVKSQYEKMLKEFNQNKSLYCAQYAKTEITPETAWDGIDEKIIKNFKEFSSHLNEWCSKEESYLTAKENLSPQPLKLIKSITVSQPVATKYLPLSSELIVSNDTAYFSNKTQVNAYGISNGRSLWQFEATGIPITQNIEKNKLIPWQDNLSDVKSYPIGKINNLICEAGIIFFKADMHSIFAVNGLSGKLLWSQGWSQGQSMGYNQYYILGVLAAQDERVYVPGYYPGLSVKSDIFQDNIKPDYFLLSLDAKTGKVIWKFKPKGYITSNPLIINGLVYVATSEGILYAIDSQNGKMKWKTTVDQNIYALSHHANKIILATQNTVSAVDATKGQLLWNYKNSANTSPNNQELTFTKKVTDYINDPIVSGDVVIITDYGKGTLLGLQADSGTLLWQQNFELDKNSPSTLLKNIILSGTGQFAYGESGDKEYRLTLHATNIENGKEKWQTRLPRNIQPISPIISTGTNLFFLTNSGEIQIFDMISNEY